MVFSLTSIIFGSVAIKVGWFNCSFFARILGAFFFLTTGFDISIFVPQTGQNFAFALKL